MGLAALGWVLEEERRAERFLSLTGLTPDVLRAMVGTPAAPAAALDFLAGHEADLLAAAGALDISPGALSAARAELAR